MVAFVLFRFVCLRVDGTHAEAMSCGRVFFAHSLFVDVTCLSKWQWLTTTANGLLDNPNNYLVGYHDKWRGDVGGGGCRKVLMFQAGSKRRKEAKARSNYSSKA